MNSFSFSAAQSAIAEEYILVSVQSCELAEQFFVLPQFRVVLWLQLSFSVLSILLVLLTFYSYSSWFESVFKARVPPSETLFVLLTFILIHALATVILASLHIFSIWTAKTPCDAQIDSRFCYIRTATYFVFTSFVWIHANITVQRVLTTFTGNYFVHCVIARGMIVAVIPYASFMTYITYNDYTFHGFTPFCTGYSTEHADIIQSNTFAMLVVDFISFLVDLMIILYNRTQFKALRNHSLAEKFRHRQTYYSTKQFLPVAFLHLVFFAVQHVAFSITMNQKISNHAEFLTNSGMFYLMPYYTFSCPALILFLMRRGKLQREASMKSAIGPKEDSDFHFRELHKLFHVIDGAFPSNAPPTKSVERDRKITIIPMKLPFLLIAGATLVTGFCPSMLSRVHTKRLAATPNIREAIDTVCGRRNFTAVFWSDGLYSEVADYMANGKFKGEKNLGYRGLADAMYLSSALKPLMQSLEQQLQAMDNHEAKAFMDKAKALHCKCRVIDARGTASIDVADEIMIAHKQLSMDAQFALAQSMKRGFGYEETSEMRKKRIEIAMTGLERSKYILKENYKLAEAFGHVQLLAGEYISFNNFSSYMSRKFDHPAVTNLEVVPAIESLYVQYRTLSNMEAKSFIQFFLVSRLQGIARTADDFANDRRDRWAFESDRKLFYGISENARSEIIATFPEFVAYAESNCWIEKKRRI